jgi:fumigallin biosynthesis monooxygenase-like protein
MAKVVPGRFTADIDGNFVVFIIGMRVNKPLKLRQWLPVAGAMPRMLRWLGKNPQAGLLGYHSGGTPRAPMLVQYWRSFEDLERFAKQPDAPHLSPWRRFLKEIGNSGDVGIWHETYKVRAGEYEAVYGNMPVFGLAKATSHVPVGKRGESAARRIGASSDDVV